MTDMITVSTDYADYLPGSTATMTATVDVGATVNFLVMHIVDPGADGIYGTADDIVDMISWEQARSGPLRMAVQVTWTALPTVPSSPTGTSTRTL